MLRILGGYMADKYFRRVFARAWTMTLADVGLEKPRLVAAKLLWAVVTLAILWYAGILQDVIVEFGKGSAAALAFLVILAIFYFVNIARAAAVMDGESAHAISDLQRQLYDREARQRAIDALWELRSDGITHRNKHVESVEKLRDWNVGYQEWREKVLTQSGLVDKNLRQYLSRLDRMGEGPQDVMARVLNGEHGRLVRIMSEMLQRLQSFLTKDLHA